MAAPLSDLQAGQVIPVSLSLLLNEPISIAGLSLDLYLVGTLRVNSESGPVAWVRASLAEALTMWLHLRPRHDDAMDADNSSDGKAAVIAAGQYDLPLRVTVPTHTPLPPSYDGAFRVSYALRAELSSRHETLLGAAELPFELLPATTPRPVQPIPPHSVWLPTSNTSTARWTLQPVMAGAAFSPTERIPLILKVGPPDDADYREHDVRVRATLMREERVAGPLSPATTISTVVAAVSVSETTATVPIEVVGCLPLMQGPTWEYGHSTSATAGGLVASSRFHVRLDVVISRLETGEPSQLLFGDRVVRHCVPACQGGIWDELQPNGSSARVAQHTFTVPVEIGSVAEPLGAAYTHTWADIEWGSDGTGHLVTGNALSSENGWFVAPPPYAEALWVAPHVTS